jgi:hypothetical protein
MQQMQMQIQQMQETLQKVDQQKMMMNQAKIDDDAQRTIIEERKLEVETQFKAKELELKELGMRLDTMKTDLVEDTKKEIAMINHDSSIKGKIIDNQKKEPEQKEDVKGVIEELSKGHTKILDEIKKDNASFKKDIEKVVKKTEKPKETKQPNINITVPVQTPGKSNAKIVPKKDGGYDVIQGE